MLRLSWHGNASLRRLRRRALTDVADNVRGVATLDEGSSVATVPGALPTLGAAHLDRCRVFKRSLDKRSITAQSRGHALPRSGHGPGRLVADLGRTTHPSAGLAGP